MAKREKGTARAKGGTTATTAPSATPADAIEQRLAAFAEQLGRIAGTIQSKAEGWLDREALNSQIASVRDGAGELLEQLASSTPKPLEENPTATGALAGTQERSRGAVDARGKKHRKPLPADPGASIAASQAAKLRTAKTMVKTNRRRGRG